MLLILACMPKTPAPTLLEAALALEPVAFLSGTWYASDESGSVVEEWGPPGALSMNGSSQFCSPQGDCSGETLRIERIGGVFTYFAQPDSHPETAFTLTEQTPTRIVFENPTHDYPRRIVYERLGDELIATIDDGQGGSTLRWRYASSPR